MATESTQYSTIHCIFLREEFPCQSSILAELFLRFEDTNVLSRSFDKVNEIDMLCTDSLGETRILSKEKSNGMHNLELTARHSLRVSGTGSILKI
jgi:hypothetical protein